MTATTTKAPELSRQSHNGPQLGPLKVLHRGSDGYISFALKEDEDFRPSFAIKAAALDTMFPGYVEMLTRNSYVSINASYTLARGRQAEWGIPRHRNDTLKYLCACYADIDIYKVGLTFNQAHGRVMDMCEAGTVPWASMVVNSGRGMWLLWLLHDPENPDQPHLGAWGKSDHDPLRIYSQVNRSLIDRLRPLGADPQCSDGARYVRVPGSYRTDAESMVWWSIQGAGQSGFSYTLWEMADFLGINIRRMLPAETEAIQPRVRVPGRASGQVAANKSRLCAIVTLIGLRGGGFCKPYRDKGAWIYAMALCRRKVEFVDAISSVREFGRACSPQLSPADCDAQTRSGYKGGRWSYQKIASTLG